DNDFTVNGIPAPLSAEVWAPEHAQGHVWPTHDAISGAHFDSAQVSQLPVEHSSLHCCSAQPRAERSASAPPAHPAVRHFSQHALTWMPPSKWGAPSSVHDLAQFSRSPQVPEPVPKMDMPSQFSNELARRGK